jgi:transcriptional regulator with XRE-family HTH domain
MATASPPQIYFAKALRFIRVEAGVTQEELALEIRMKPSEISTFEHGKRNLQLGTMKRLAEGLGVPCWQVMWLADQFESGVRADDLNWPPPG